MQRISISACALAVASAFAATAAYAAPTVSWKEPQSNELLTGNVVKSNCTVTGLRIRKVDFFVVNSSGVGKLVDTDNASGWSCEFDTRAFANGTYTLRAVAYDGGGGKATANRSVRISNGGTTPPPPTGNTPPTVNLTSPQAGATLKGYVDSSMCAASASDTDGIEKVEFFLGDKLVKSDGTTPYQCSIDTKLYTDGTYQLIAKATDRRGGFATSQREVKIQNGSTQTPPPPPPPSAAIDPADVLTVSLSDTLFSQQSGYNGQVMGTFPSVQSIPESGIHGPTMSNGESLRLGKEIDPANPARKALAFALAPNDPTTSGSKRSEFKFPKNIDFGSTYWTAFRLFVPDWGTLNSDDQAVFGTQLHTGATGSGTCLPAFSMTAVNNGRDFRLHARGAGARTDLAVKPIPFGRWADFVFKFRQGTGSNGLLQVWMDGQQIASYTGELGCQTSTMDYVKFGYYNYSAGFNAPRKLLMRQVVLVKDPTGSKYTPETLRAFAVQ
ncbi:MAG TPA: Ig-like domain-containing protein [Vicinamibacterales bacterium]|nr:Ig-like domain-containing protein [Vicinamibacterales bacterium]